MSYVKTTWQTGDTVTAEKLNHAEQGIENNSMEVYASTDVEGVLHFDLTYNQVVAALQAHKDIRLYTTSFADGNPDMPIHRLDPVVGTMIGSLGGDPPAYYYAVNLPDGPYAFSTDPDDPLTTADPT